jgi:hypothetical protein
MITLPSDRMSDLPPHLPAPRREEYVVPLVVGLSMDDLVRDASTFSKNRDRLLKKKVAKRFFQKR